MLTCVARVVALNWDSLCQYVYAVIAIRIDDPLAAKMANVDDVEREMPGELERIMCWFRDYKV